MQADLFLGDEAVAQGAIDAGLVGAFAYPGTPSTEIFEHIERYADEYGIAARWSANEKVAYEEALGTSYAGRRALVSMKHVGLNVAADPFMSSALTGVNGGLVLVVADDPGMHSSQNEQDTRFYGDFAKLPVFEPATQQEAYDFTREAFDYSEKIGLPVIVRIVTRLAHSRADVRRGDFVEQRPRPDAVLQDTDRWVLVPSNARKRYTHLLEVQDQIIEDAARSPHNRLRLVGPRGIIAAGVARNYVHEVLGDELGEHSLLEIGMYPLPTQLIRELVDHTDEIYVFEDGYPYIERQLKGLLGLKGKAVRGRLDGALPPAGELNPDIVTQALYPSRPLPAVPRDDLSARPPQLCRGCPHGDSFRAIVEATADAAAPLLLSDIGCYSLGVMAPYRAIHTVVDMGASIGMASGAAQSGAHPVVCTIGDSTFAHSGLPALLAAAYYDHAMTVVILDNSAVAMTGIQDSLLGGDRLVNAVLGLGVDPEHCHVIEPHPKKHLENVALFRREIEHRGLSVVIARRPCIHVNAKLKKRATLEAAKAEEAAR